MPRRRAGIGDRGRARGASIRDRRDTPALRDSPGRATSERSRTGGVSPPIIDAIAPMQAVFAEGAYDIVTGDAEKLAGRPSHLLREVLNRAFT